VALNGATRSVEMDVGAMAPDFIGNLGDRCDCKGDTTPGLGDLVRLIPSSPRGTGSGGCAR
jgi:hypothetical protein